MGPIDSLPVVVPGGEHTFRRACHVHGYFLLPSEEGLHGRVNAGRKQATSDQAARSTRMHVVLETGAAVTLTPSMVRSVRTTRSAKEHTATFAIR